MLTQQACRKGRIITSENKQSLEKHEENLDSITTGQGDAQSVATGTGNGLAKAAIVRSRWCCRRHSSCRFGW